MIGWWVLAAIFLLVFIGISGISLFGYRNITQKKKFTSEECFEVVEKRGLFTKTQFEKLSKQEIVIENKDGLKLHSYYIETNPLSKKVMILLHGYTRAYPMSMQFTELYIKHGFNLLAIDHRAHGESEGKHTSYGYYEKYDIDSWVNWIREHIGVDTLIGLHGISLGGGTALEYLHINQHAKFIIADCPYSDLAELIRYQIKHIYKAPTFIFYHTIGLLVKIFARFRLADVRPISAVANSDVPIFFIHGNRDHYIPAYMSKNLYEAKQRGLKRLYIAEGAGHGDAFRRNKKRYEEEVSTFLQEVFVMNGNSVEVV
ncbi:alpha/beta hydrolase [Shimazuella sp. AN120528]|uniref:alpha/beta hydrolase n=1 Tax=Shimazuella soli TaxID=1892854 RepID=UPI001F107F7A|nr:alpha/beta hydrolase [Shimazuella soli]MCH5584621.1 alpha/beta hydrolase [Shimazuella soli]